MKPALVVACLALFGCDDAVDGSDLAVRDLSVPLDFTSGPDIGCDVNSTMRDCFAMHRCCAPCPAFGVYGPNDVCDIVGLECAYETYAFQCGSDHHYHCIEYQNTVCHDGGF
jgi:hypothetical protein